MVVVNKLIQVEMSALPEPEKASGRLPAILVNRFHVRASAELVRMALGEQSDQETAVYHFACVLTADGARKLAELLLHTVDKAQQTGASVPPGAVEAK